MFAVELFSAGLIKTKELNENRDVFMLLPTYYTRYQYIDHIMSLGIVQLFL